MHCTETNAKEVMNTMELIELASRPERPVRAQEPLLLRPDEVAELLGVSRSKVYEMLAGGRLPRVRVGSSLRVPRHRLLRWIDQRTLEASA